MAKKKVTTNQTDATKQQNVPEKNQEKDKSPPLSREPSMEDPVEKLQNLKALNAMLLKETVEKRQQIGSLDQAKKKLEAELIRSAEEKTGLVAELTRVSDENVALELEKGLFWTVVETYMREMVDGVDGLMRQKSESASEIRFLKSEVNELMSKLENDASRLSQVCSDRDQVRVDFELQVKEANLLRGKVIELEKKENVLEEKVEKLKAEKEGLIEEKRKSKNAIDAVMRDKDDLEKRLKEKAKEIKGLKREIEGIVREKKEMEVVKSAQNTKINELGSELEKLNETASNLKNEEQVLCRKVFELEKSLDLAQEKEKDMKIEMDTLTKEKSEKAEDLERLMEEKRLIAKQLEIARSESKEKEKSIGALSREKTDFEELLARGDAEIVALNKEVSEFRDFVLKLQNACKDQEEKNKDLSNEISKLADVLDSFKAEKRNAEKSLREEREISLSLRSKFAEMEKRIEQADKELKSIRIERDGLTAKEKEMGTQWALLIKQKAIIENDLYKARQAIDDLKAKLESDGVHSDRVLALLKSTAAMLCRSGAEDNGFINERNLEKDIEAYVAELEAIKQAFKNKETNVEDMKKQVEFMKHSVTQAHNKKSIWTLISSAAIFAAISVAYVARIR